MTVVARLLRGEPLDLVARETNVSVARLTEWGTVALAKNRPKQAEKSQQNQRLIFRISAQIGLMQQCLNNIIMLPSEYRVRRDPAEPSAGFLLCL